VSALSIGVCVVNTVFHSFAERVDSKGTIVSVIISPGSRVSVAKAGRRGKEGEAE